MRRAARRMLMLRRRNWPTRDRRICKTRWAVTVAAGSRGTKRQPLFAALLRPDHRERLRRDRSTQSSQYLKPVTALLPRGEPGEIRAEAIDAIERGERRRLLGFHLMIPISRRSDGTNE